MYPCFNFVWWMLLNLHSIDPAHAVYDAHPRRCTSHSMRRADSAKGSARKCDRLKVAGCLGCELGLKELKPCQLYERLLRQSITGRCVWWCENELDDESCQAVTIGCDMRGVASLAWGGVRAARHGRWLVSDRPRRATPPHATPLATPHVSIVNVELYSVNCGLLTCFWNFLY